MNNNYKLSEALWCDLKTDADRANWLLLGRGYETGIISASIQNDLAMAYHKLALITENVKPFEDVWSKYVEKGYNYGDDALEQVKFGYEIALGEMTIRPA